MDKILKSIAGGFMIGIGGAVYMSCDVKFMGAIFFALGLFTICEFGLGLYTGKIGYLLKNKGNFYIEVLQTLLGNLIGTLLAGLMIGFSKPQLAEKASELCNAKLLQNPIQTLILSFFCGILMYIAVSIFKKNSGVGKYIGIFTAVPVFIISGFEHSIANLFYFFCAGIVNLQMIIFTLICVVGNAVGAIAIAAFDK